MKKSILTLTVIGAMFLASCGGSKTETTETVVAADSTDLKTEIEADEAAATESDSLKLEIEEATENLGKTLNGL
ncbi:MAG: hypothetical protein V4667_09440 [Bacteroidota bacterium]